MAHTSSCRNTRIEPLKPVSTCFEEIRETEASLLFPVSVWPVSIQRIDLHGPLISYVILGFDSNVLDSGDILRCVQFIYRVRSENSFSFSLSRSSYRSRNFRVFFLSRPSPRTEWYSFEISMGDCYRIPALVQVCLRFTA